MLLFLFISNVFSDQKLSDELIRKESQILKDLEKLNRSSIEKGWPKGKYKTLESSRQWLKSSQETVDELFFPKEALNIFKKIVTKALEVQYAFHDKEGVDHFLRGFMAQGEVPLYAINSAAKHLIGPEELRYSYHRFTSLNYSRGPYLKVEWIRGGRVIRDFSIAFPDYGVESGGDMNMGSHWREDFQSYIFDQIKLSKDVIFHGTKSERNRAWKNLQNSTYAVQLHRELGETRKQKVLALREDYRKAEFELALAKRRLKECQSALHKQSN